MNDRKVLSLRIIMDNEFEEKFNKIKNELGLNSNAEVVRFLVNRFYKELIRKGTLISFLFKFADTVSFIDIVEVCAAI